MQRTTTQLDPDNCHIWLVRLNSLQVRLDEFEAVLSDQERERADRFVNKSLRDDFVLAHGWMRHALAEYTGECAALQTFVQGEHGKPRLVDDGIAFNLSHSHGVAALAVAKDARIGIDIQFRDPDVDMLAIARRFFAREEVDWLQSVDEGRRLDVFYRIWTLKEAYIKAIGVGMALPLSDFAFADDGDGRGVRLVRQPVEWQSKWFLSNFDSIGEYSLALISDQEYCTPVVVQYFA